MLIDEIKENNERIKSIDLMINPLIEEREVLRKLIISKNNEFSNAYYLKYKFSEFVEKENIPKDIVETLNKFWSMI